MDPISASLLAAIVAAIQKRATGAAAEYLVNATKHAAERMRGIITGSDDVKHAEALLAHVLGEAAAYPPDRAVYVECLSTIGTVGIWDGGQLGLNVLWMNRADFDIRIRDVKLTARAGGRPEWEINKGDEFVLRARREHQSMLRGPALLDLPKFERGGVACDITVSALVSGPWEHGLAQRTHQLYSGTLWIPVYLDQPDVLTEAADIDIALRHFLQQLLDKGIQNEQVTYAALDKTLKLQPGSTKTRLPLVAATGRHTYEAGPKVGYLTLHYAPDFLGPVGGRGGFVDEEF